MLIIGTVTLVLLITLTRNKDIFIRIMIGILTYSTFLSYQSFITTEIISAENIGILGGLFQTNNLITGIEISILILSIILITFILENQQKQIIEAEYIIILAFSILGMVTLIASQDLISTFLAIELQSLSLYIITTITRKEATAAGLKYYLLGSLSSAILLLGLVLIYSLTGITHYDGLISLITVTSENIGADLIGYQEITTISKLTIIIIVLVMVGLLFKIGAAPFHNWAPDVYDSVPTIVTSWIAIMGKVSILAFILTKQFQIDLDLVILNSVSFTIFAVSAILSLIIGSILGLVQHRIKRLLTYSSISHLGFLLLALTNNNCLARSAFLFYMFQYWLTTVNSFGILISLTKKTDIESISSFQGLFKFNPVLTIALIINFFSLTGIPPLIGFFGKQMILYTSLLNGYYLMTTIAILTSVISAAYYLRIIKTATFNLNDQTNYWFTTSITKINSENNNLSILSWIISIISLISLLFFINPTIILNFCHLLALTFQ